jgi:hypothetical protein
MLNYFQLLNDYFLLVKVISPSNIYGYLWLFSNTSSYFLLFHSRLFLVVLSSILVVKGYFTLCVYWQF